MSGYPEVRITTHYSHSHRHMLNEESGYYSCQEPVIFQSMADLKTILPYVFRNETLKGNLTMQSRQVDATAIMAAMTPDTTAVTNTKQTQYPSLSSPVPKNIDFDFNAFIKNSAMIVLKQKMLRENNQLKKDLNYQDAAVGYAWWHDINECRL